MQQTAREYKVKSGDTLGGHSRNTNWQPKRSPTSRSSTTTRPGQADAGHDARAARPTQDHGRREHGEQRTLGAKSIEPKTTSQAKVAAGFAQVHGALGRHL